MNRVRRRGAFAVGLALAALTALEARQGPPRAPDAFYVPSRPEVVDAMLRLAEVTPADLVYDLGSGDGRVVVMAAQRFGARAVGIEIDPALVARARAAAEEAGVADRVRFVEGDLFTTDLTGATVVTLYLSTLTNRRLASRLRRDLPSGARIVSQQFDFGAAWPPDTRSIHDATMLFLWRVP